MKISKKRFLILSSILSFSAGLISVSCTSITPGDQGGKPSDSSTPNPNDKDKNPTTPDTKVPDAAEVKALDTVAQKVTFSVPNSSNILSSLVNKELLVTNNLDEKKYKVNISSVQQNNDKQSVIVLYNIQKIDGTAKSDSRVFVINGFKKTTSPFTPIPPTPIPPFNPNPGFKRQPLSTSELNGIASGLKFDYIGKSSVFPSDAITTQVATPAVLPNNNIGVIVSSVEPFGFNSVKVFYFVNDRLYNTSISGRFSYVISGFRSLPLSKQELIDENNKLTLMVPNISNVFAKDFDTSTIIAQNIDPNKVNFVVQGYSVNKDLSSVTLNYIIMDKGNPSNVLENQSKIISGFKFPTITSDTFDQIAKNITFDYPNKKETLASNVNSSSIIINNPDSNTDIIITSVNPEGANRRSIAIGYKLVDKRHPENSVEKTFNLSGFKPLPTLVQTLNAFAGSVTFDYPQKSEIFAGDVNKAKIISNSPLGDLTRVDIIDAKKDNANRLVNITYTLDDVNSNNKSNIMTKTISGFKAPFLTTQQLIDESKKVTFSYEGIANTLVTSINKASILSSGNDTSRTKVEITSFKPNSDMGEIQISYKILDLNYETNYQNSEFILKGFKKPTFTSQQLNNLAKSIEVNYPQKSETLLTNISNDKIKFSSYPEGTTRIHIISVTKNDNENSVSIQYTLDDLNSTNKSSVQTALISDFRKPSIQFQKIIQIKDGLSFTYEDKPNLLVYQVQQSKIKVVGNDASKTKVEIKSIKLLPEEGEVQVAYKISDVTDSNTFLEGEYNIKGFKRSPLSTDTLNKIATSLVFDYSDKRNTFATSANKAGVIIPKLPRDDVEVDITRVMTDKGDNSISIVYQIKDKLYDTNLSDVKTETISGFRVNLLSQQDFTNESTKISFEYPSKATTFAKDLNLNNLRSSNVDESKFRLVVLGFGVMPDQVSVRINYLLVDKQNPSNFSQNLSKIISGFKMVQTESTHLSLEQLSEIVKSLVFTYPTRNTTSASEANTSGVRVFNPNGLTTVHINSVSVNSSDNRSIDVNYTITDTNFPTVSQTNSVIIEGFKHQATQVSVLNQMANSLTISYPNVAQAFATEVANGSISFSGYTATIAIPELKRVSVNTDQRSINVTYVLKDLFSNNVSSETTKTLSGFKLLPMTNQQLLSDASGITFTYAGKENIPVSSAQKASIIGVGNSVSKTDIEILNFIPTDSRTGITVYYKLIDKNYPTNFIIQTFTLNGFKVERLSSDYLNGLANTITLNYPNKNQTSASSVQSSSVRFAGDLSRVNVHVISATPKTDNPTEATIVYTITDKNYSDNKVTVTKVLGGFKGATAPVVVTNFTKEQLDQQLENAVLTVNRIETKTVDEVKNSDYVLLGVDTSRLEVSIKSTEVSSRTSITVKFAIKQIGGSIESNEKTQILTGFKFSLPTGEPFVRPSGDEVFPTAQPIPNSSYDVSIASSKPVFDYKAEGTNSYRIPNPIKLANGDILISADKRFDSAADSGGPIEQVIKRSKDNGKTWSRDSVVIKISGPRVNNGLVIDGSLSEVWVDKNDHSKGKKLIYWADFFPYYRGIGSLESGTPFKKVGSTILWKAFVRNGSSRSSDYVFRKSAVRPGWWRLWKLPSGKSVDSLVESDIRNLVAQNTYLDMTYDPQNRSVSGQIFENVTDENNLWNPTFMRTKATLYSIFDDPGSANSKYSVLGTDYNGVLESYDNGLTWTNFQITDADWRYNDTVPFIGAGVGNGLQLNHQKNSSLNGRILFPVYSYREGTQRTFYIYSDDNGGSWHEMKFSGFDNQELSESSMVETNNGEIYWLFRGPFGRSKVSVSRDGGITWHSPIPGDTGSIYQLNQHSWNGNVFTGLTHFTVKGQTYFVFSAPENGRRQNGVLYITKDWQHIDRIWAFDTNHREHFQYSYPVTIEEGANYADIILAYEWNRNITILGQTPLTKPDGSQRPVGSAITVDKFRIIVK